MWEAEGKRRDGGRPEEGRMQDVRQIHNCDLDQIDLSVCDRRAVKHGLKTRTYPTASFTPVVFAHHIIYTHTLAHTHKPTSMHLYMRCILKASMLKAIMEHNTCCRVHLCVHMHI